MWLVWLQKLEIIILTFFLGITKKILFYFIFLLIIQEWLKPGGQIMVSEYVHGKNHPNHPEEYIEYVKQRGYQLLNIADYVKVLTE